MLQWPLFKFTYFINHMLLVSCSFQPHKAQKEADASKRALTRFNFPPHTFRHDFFVEMFCGLTHLVVSYLRNNMSRCCISLSRSCQSVSIQKQSLRSSLRYLDGRLRGAIQRIVLVTELFFFKHEKLL